MSDPRAKFVHDRQLLDTLEQLGGRPLQHDVWRVSWASRNVLQGGWGAGRWNATGVSQALYTSLDMDGAIAEIYYHLSQHPVRSTADKLLYRLMVSTKNTLCLDDRDTLARLGLGPQSLALTDVARSQEIGAAAHLLEYDSLLVPNARWPCSNLVIFSELMGLGAIEVHESSPINWPAWREKNAEQWDAITEGQRRERIEISRS